MATQKAKASKVMKQAKKVTTRTGTMGGLPYTATRVRSKSGGVKASVAVNPGGPVKRVERVSERRPGGGKQSATLTSREGVLGQKPYYAQRTTFKGPKVTGKAVNANVQVGDRTKGRFIKDGKAKTYKVERNI